MSTRKRPPRPAKSQPQRRSPSSVDAAPVPDGAPKELVAVYRRLHVGPKPTSWEQRLTSCKTCDYQDAVNYLIRLRALRRDAAVLVDAFIFQGLEAMAKERRLASLLRQTRVRSLVQAKQLVVEIDGVHERWVKTWEAKMSAANKSMLAHHLDWTYAQTLAFLEGMTALNECDIRKRRWP